LGCGPYLKNILFFYLLTIFCTAHTPHRRQPLSAIVNGKLDSVLSIVSEQRELILKQEKEKEALHKHVSDLRNDLRHLKEVVQQGSVAPKARKKSIPRDLSVSVFN